MEDLSTSAAHGKEKDNGTAAQQRPQSTYPDRYLLPRLRCSRSPTAGIVLPPLPTTSAINCREIPVVIRPPSVVSGALMVSWMVKWARRQSAPAVHDIPVVARALMWMAVIACRICVTDDDGVWVVQTWWKETREVARRCGVVVVQGFDSHEAVVREPLTEASASVFGYVGVVDVLPEAGVCVHTGREVHFR